MSQILIERLSKSFHATQVLHALNLTIAQGEFVTLLGPSGCGKTTTLRCVAGLETPTDGLIRIGDAAVVDSERRRFVPPHRRKVGMVFQSYAIWPHMSALSNVEFPLKRRRIGSPSERRATAIQALEAVGMGGHLKRYAHELSGGQQQRVALARGLVSAGDVMLYDEPLSNLDAKLRVQMREEVRRLHDTFGHTSIYVTHDQEEAFAISDRIVVMNGGRVEQAGSPEEIFGSPATRYVADFIGYENILEAQGASGEGVTLAGGLEATGTDAVPGDAVAFRSTTVRPGALPSGAKGLAFEASVARRVFAGDDTVWHLRTGGGQALTARLDTGVAVGDGERLPFWVDAADLVVLTA